MFAHFSEYKVSHCWCLLHSLTPRNGPAVKNKAKQNINNNITEEYIACHVFSYILVCLIMIVLIGCEQGLAGYLQNVLQKTSSQEC